MFTFLLAPASYCMAQDTQKSSVDVLSDARHELGFQLPHRFYVGIHKAAQVFRVTSMTYPIDEAVLNSVYAFAGYQFGPHWSVQAGFMQDNPPSEETFFVSINKAGQAVETRGYVDYYDAVVPVLMRYDIARRPPHRLHLDVLLGLTLLIHRYQADGVSTTNGQIVYEAHEYSRANNLNVTAGVGIGYRVTPHVDLMAEATLHRNLTSMESAYARQLMPGIGAGLRYCFNLSRTASTPIFR